MRYQRVSTLASAGSSQLSNGARWLSENTHYLLVNLEAIATHSLKTWWENCYRHSEAPHVSGYFFRVCDLFVAQKLVIFSLVLRISDLLHTGHLLWIVAGLISPWDQREIKLVQRLHLFAYRAHKLNLLSLELPPLSYPILSKVLWWHCSVYYPEIAPVNRRLRKVSFSCPQITWCTFLDSKFPSTGCSSQGWVIRHQRSGGLFMDVVEDWKG